MENDAAEDPIPHYREVLAAAGTTGRRPRREELDAHRESGLRAARAGVPLRPLIDRYLAATRAAFAELAAGTATELLAAGQALLAAAAQSVSAVLEGYERAQRIAITEDETGRRELIDDLLGGQRDPAQLAERAERFGVLLASPHIVVLADSEQGFEEQESLVRKIEMELVGRFGTHNVLVAGRDSLLVCILPATLRGAPGEFAHRLLTVLGTDTAWQVAVGRAHSGPSGVLRSYEEARNALYLAQRLGFRIPVVHAADLMVFPVLMRDQAALIDLIRTVLAPLAHARGGAKPLLDTLATVFECQGNSTAAARRLGISVRAVAYRLDRIRRLTGYAPDEPTQRFTLEAAVIGARLLDWPAYPLPAE